MKSLILLLLLVCTNAYSFIAKPSTYQIQQSKRFVVQIVCDNGSGTGVIIDNNKVLTALHVISGSANCVILDNKNKDYIISKVKFDEDHDLALLTTTVKFKSHVGLATELYEYAPIWTIGFPINFNYIVSEGRNNGQHEVIDWVNISSMSIIFGNSGGPIFVVEDGIIKVAGIVDAITPYKKEVIYHLSLFINLKTVRSFIKK